jgi:hypothetical protein
VDITTSRAAVRYKRDEKGLVPPGAVPQWEIKSVAFQLALPSPSERVCAMDKCDGDDLALPNRAERHDVVRCAIGI